MTMEAAFRSVAKDGMTSGLAPDSSFKEGFAAGANTLLLAGGVVWFGTIIAEPGLKYFITNVFLLWAVFLIAAKIGTRRLLKGPRWRYAIGCACMAYAATILLVTESYLVASLDGGQAVGLLLAFLGPLGAYDLSSRYPKSGRSVF